MGLRKALQEKPGLTLAVCGLLVVGMISLALYRSFASDAAPGSDRSGSAYFTDDDGATFFTASVSNVAPFDRNGKQAVRCFVFTCDGGKSKFVGYLQRYTAESRKRREEMISGKSPDAASPFKPLELEVKKPGDAAWVRMTDPRAAMITEPRSPGGSSSAPVPVDPD